MKSVLIILSLLVLTNVAAKPYDGDEAEDKGIQGEIAQPKIEQPKLPEFSDDDLCRIYAREAGILEETLQKVARFEILEPQTSNKDTMSICRENHYNYGFFFRRFMKGSCCGNLSE